MLAYTDILCVDFEYSEWCGHYQCQTIMIHILDSAPIFITFH